MQKAINGLIYRKMIISAAKLLEANKQHVDALNVFPVPDGDTGTNMSLTMMSAGNEVAACQNNNLDSLANAVSKGALRGARGNSGVILSQIFKGMNLVFMEHPKDITPKIFAKAMRNGAEIAYKAVTKPKEGTILTVIREMADHAMLITKKNIDITAFLKEVIAAGEDVLQRTPDMLPVLKKAGVVDAGGRGLLVIFSGFYNVLTGDDKLDIQMEFSDTIDSSSAAENFERFHQEPIEITDIEFAYCTEFFITNLHKKTTSADIDRFREKLMTIGDCVLVIGDLSLVKVHVHTNEPGNALQHALEMGEIDKVKIENMLEQNRNFAGIQKENLKPMGMVVVCAGEGLSNIFKELSVDNIIEGGQTMNPSAQDIAGAVDKVLAEDVFVFPNNNNIILAAQQAKEITKRRLHIIPTKNIPQGLSAVIAFNPDSSVEENLSEMTAALEDVKAGLVTYAVRNYQVDNFDLKEGDIIGIDSKSILAKGESLEQVTQDLIDKMIDKKTSNITLYFGNDVQEDNASAIASTIREQYPKCDVVTHFGGQPLYYYIISLS